MAQVGSTDIFKGASIIRSKITEVLAATTLSSGSSSVTSSTFISMGYRSAMAYMRINDTGSTAIANVQFTPQFATDSAGSNYYSFLEGVWASMTFSAVQIQSSTFYRAHNLQLNGRRTRMLVERDSTAENTNFSISVSLEAQD